MALSLKKGVIFEGIHSRIIESLALVDRCYLKFGFDGVITSARDGRHKANSLHYVGRALDLRTSFFTPLQRQEFHRDLQYALGSDFDVVLEKDHVHYEFDP